MNYRNEQVKSALRGSILNANSVDCKVWSIEVSKLENALNLINHYEAEIMRLEELVGFLKMSEPELCDIVYENHQLKKDVAYKQRQLENVIHAHDEFLLNGQSNLVRFAITNAYKAFAEAYKDQVKNYTGMFTDDGFYVSLSAILDAVDFVCEKKVEELVGEG